MIITTKNVVRLNFFLCIIMIIIMIKTKVQLHDKIDKIIVK